LSIAARGEFVAVGSTTIQLLSSNMEAWRRSVLDTDEDYEAIVEVCQFLVIFCVTLSFLLSVGLGITCSCVYT